MRIETLCTGDELLTGLTSDTNSRFFQGLLLDRCGLTVRRGVVVRDDEADIEAALREAAARCDVLLVSGGLGPTRDDLTAGCAARVAGVPLVVDEASVQHVEARLGARGLAMTEVHRRQARVPEGAEVVQNGAGSAPLFILRLGGCTAFFVPGVPSEYRHLVETQVVPRIAALAPATGWRVLRLLKTVGLVEAELSRRTEPLEAKHPAVTFGFRAHWPEVHFKLLATGETEASARAALAAAEADVRAALGEAVFGVDAQTLPGVVLEALAQRGERLALAESCTGGLVSALLTDVPGSSRALFGGVVAYANEAKTRWVKVPEATLSAHGAVSEETARALAEGIRAEAGVDWGVSLTGVAGPGGGSPEKPVGTVFIAVASSAGTQVRRCAFSGERDRVRRTAAHTALDLLRLALAQRA